MSRKGESPEIVERFRQALSQTAKTQLELADAIGYSKSFVAQIATGKSLMSGSFLKALIDEGYDVVWILTGRRTDMTGELETKDKIIKELRNIISSAMKGEK